MATELTTYENENAEATTRRFIRDGIAGNYEVVFQMVRIIRNSETDSRVKKIIAELMNERNLTSYSEPERLLKVIFDYVKENVHYIQDAAGSVESVKSAYRTLSDHFGDCDDLTVTCCSLAGAIGFENVNIALAKYSKDDTSFQHVYCIVYSDNNRYVLDASLPNAQFNAEVKPFEVKEINVFDTVQGIDGVSGIWANGKHFAKGAAKATLGAIPNLVNYIPLGFASSAALSGGVSLLNATNKQTKSLSETATAINKKLDVIINALVKGEIALDLAQSEAARAVSQFSLITDIPNKRDYEIIKHSISEKTAFIKNYEAIAKQFNLPIVYLNSNAMLALGVGAGAYGAYKLYKLLTKEHE